MLEELRGQHGDLCWGAVASKVNRDHNWRLYRMEMKRIVEHCREVGGYRNRTAPRPASVVLTAVLKRKIIKAALNTNTPRYQRSTLGNSLSCDMH